MNFTLLSYNTVSVNILVYVHGLWCCAVYFNDFRFLVNVFIPLIFFWIFVFHKIVLLWKKFQLNIVQRKVHTCLTSVLTRKPENVNEIFFQLFTAYP